jgi:hypothetical protein
MPVEGDGKTQREGADNVQWKGDDDTQDDEAPQCAGIPEWVGNDDRQVEVVTPHESDDEWTDDEAPLVTPDVITEQEGTQDEATLGTPDVITEQEGDDSTLPSLSWTWFSFCLCCFL